MYNMKMVEELIKQNREQKFLSHSGVYPNTNITRVHYHFKGLSLSIRNSLIDGEGLFAECEFQAENTICKSEGYIVDLRNRHIEPWESRISYELGKYQHFVPTNLVDAPVNGLAKVNNSCNPNSYVQLEPKSNFLVLRALKYIHKDEEITCDYCVTETKLAHPFICLCGDESCRRFVIGAQFKKIKETKISEYRDEVVHA